MRSSPRHAASSRRPALAAALLLATAALAPLATHADEAECGSLKNGYGPFDYSNPEHREKNIPVVEQYHLNADVENLVRGQSQANLLGDLDYTLRAVPNHYRALDAVGRYQLRGGDMRAFRTADCYFDRAIRFRPDDGYVYLVYGVFLQRKKEIAKAESAYRRAVKLLPSTPEPYYNLALLLLEQGRTAEARKLAVNAYALGHPLPGLRKKLTALGAWDESDNAAVAAGMPPPEDEGVAAPAPEGAPAVAAPVAEAPRG